MKWIWIAWLAILTGCGSSLVGEDEAADLLAGPHQVDYHVSWDTDGVKLSGDGLELTNNLGYDIQLHSGYLVFYSTQRVPCADDE